jgi:hypothetical protein
MKKEEFITSLVYNGQLVNVGIDDYGQTYFIEYVDGNGALVEDCVGAYTSNYMDYIEHQLTPYIIPTGLCQYKDDPTMEWECDHAFTRGFCNRCPKAYSKDRWFEILERQRKTSELLEELKNNKKDETN